MNTIQSSKCPTPLTSASFARFLDQYTRAGDNGISYSSARIIKLLFHKEQENRLICLIHEAKKPHI